ncbi:hypothetical protein XU18_1660 [Perkinsela sp. CCAP 1560/4]|nr:hypothetical protein XU18_1660 [Perkinsela sp. CCAP 1560/4]|eukprot:KNH07693.1 hypothetical protein XU18_1660 [Perkinsela sp. CCAP 1560/4]
MQVPSVVVTHPSYLTEMVDEITKRDWRAQSFTPALVQLANAATLPGAVSHAVGLPDMHAGYGFAIGNVVATAMPNQSHPEGVICPGGIGFDINCGVRVIKTSLRKSDLTREIKERLAQELFTTTLPGINRKGLVPLSDNAMLDDVLSRGMGWAVENGYAWEEDLARCEDQGCIRDCSAALVSSRAKKRGIRQLGTLGTGNHYLEVQVVDEILDQSAASAYGLNLDQVVIMLHCGSRGLGHQVASEAVCAMESAMTQENRIMNDIQLSCAPISSTVGMEYFQAMNAAANFAFANRSCLTYFVRKAFENVFEQSADDLEMSVLYDVAHNIAKREEHVVNGRPVDLMVHRKGATRSFAPYHEDVPVEYQSTGQPVLVGGSMGTKSWILKGTACAMDLTFGTTCHGAGRAQSRSSARKKDWREVMQDLERQEISIRVTEPKHISEESPEAYKDVNNVVDVCHSVGISEKVARLQPIAVVKG